MKTYLRKWPITYISGILYIIINSVSILISFLLFPSDFSIFENTASTLGNHNLNPDGALIFRLGNIISGICLFPFSLGLYEWRRENSKDNPFLYSSIIIGCFMGLAEIMIGIYSQEYRPFHLIWAGILFMSGALFLFINGIFLNKQSDSIRILVIINFLVVALHSILILYLTHKIIIVEWIIIFALSINLFLIIFNYKKMSRTFQIRT